MRVLLTNSVAVNGLRSTVESLNGNIPAIDAIEVGIRLVESDPDAGWVGLGGIPNMLGEVELDATIMDGKSLKAGSVGAMKGFVHPISVARKIMEHLPHVFLAGSGAERFAKEINAETGDNLTEKSVNEWRNWIGSKIVGNESLNLKDTELLGFVKATKNDTTAKGTTIFLAQDNDGNISAGSSSSGWGFKYPGRIGDSAIIGSGCYADNRYGAAACTGMGELTMRISAARSIILYMKMGMNAEDACMEAFNDLDTLSNDFKGGITLYAIDNKGGHFVLSVKTEKKDVPECDSYYWYWNESLASSQKKTPQFVNW